MVKVHFRLPSGEIKTVETQEGLSILEVAHQNKIPLEGACEGSLACSTCHVIIDDEKLYNSLPPAEEDEEDMLDLAFGLTKTSRLGCQIIVSPKIADTLFIIPSESRNLS
ncbi:MAG: 2Fe-2S ferredoxin [Candidatus Deianiraeaceae bacterium]|jgi:2Fe-2S ferredoxin